MDKTEITRLVRESGLPDHRIKDFEQDLLLFQTVARLAGRDADEMLLGVLDHMPESRREQASNLRLQSRRITTNDKSARKEKERLSHQADWLDKSADKLSAPDVSDTEKARAFATELAATTSLALRGVNFSEYCPSPQVASRFQKAHGQAVHDLMTEAGLNREQAQIAANRQVALAVALAQRDGRTVGDGIKDFTAAQTVLHKVESGHLHDVSVSHVGDDDIDGGDGRARAAQMEMDQRALDADAPDANQHSQEYVQYRQDSAARGAMHQLDQMAAEKSPSHQQDAPAIKMLREKASEHLNDRQYVIFRVLIDEGHGIHFERNASGLAAKKAINQGVEKGETPADFVMRTIPGVYHGRGSAQRAVNETVTKLAEIMRGDQDVSLGQKIRGMERREKSTEALVKEEQQKGPDRKEQSRRKGKGKGKGSELE